jgi:hypothetical protein
MLPSPCVNSMVDCDAGQECGRESAGRNILDHHQSQRRRFAAARDRSAHMADRVAQALAIFGQQSLLPCIEQKIDAHRSSIPAQAKIP